MDRRQLCAALAGMLGAPARPGLAQSAPAAGTPAQITAAVDQAGRLRMLSQRTVKAYLMLGQGVAAEDARALLRDSVQRFDAHLAALQAFQPTPAVRAALAALAAQWPPLRAWLTEAPDKATAVALYDAGEALQRAAHSLTLAYEQVSGTPADHFISMAGRQRMLSQRMAKFHFYRAWDIHEAAAAMELHLSRAHFTAVLIQIEGSPLATPAVKDSVARLRLAWEPYQQALFNDTAPGRALATAARVAESSERVLASAEALVALLTGPA